MEMNSFSLKFSAIKRLAEFYFSILLSMSFIRANWIIA